MGAVRAYTQIVNFQLEAFVSEIKTNDVIAALNSGAITFTQLLDGLKSRKQYVRFGSNVFCEIIADAPSRVNGELCLINTLGPRIGRDGAPVIPKVRKAKQPSTTSGRK